VWELGKGTDKVDEDDGGVRLGGGLVTIGQATADNRKTKTRAHSVNSV